MASKLVKRPARPRTGARPAAGRKRRAWMVGAGIAVVAAVVLAGLFFQRGRTTSGGALATLQTADFHALAFSPDNSNVAFFGHHNGIMQSTDGGRTWKALVERTGFDAMGLAVSRANSRQVSIAGHDIFQVSSDGGASWQTPTTNLPGTDIHGFAMSPDDANRLYAYVVGHGVFQSDDAGTIWQKLAGQPPADVTGLAAAGGSPETLYASSGRLGLLRSDDGGQSWEPRGRGLGDRGVFGLAVDPRTRQTVYVGTGDGLYKTTDDGGTWTKLPFPGANVVTVAVSPANSRIVSAIAVVNRQGLVYRSEDGGETWGRGHD